MTSTIFSWQSAVDGNGRCNLPRASLVSDHLATIRGAVDRAKSLTQHLLAFGRAQTLRPRSVDVNDVLRGMQSLLNTTLGGLATMVLDLEPAPTLAVVDKTQLEQAVLNRSSMPATRCLTVG